MDRLGSYHDLAGLRAALNAKEPEKTVIVSRGTCGMARGAAALVQALERELAEMCTGPDDPLIDPLSPDGQILRVHLRPYIRGGKDPETLLRAFIQTANEWCGSPKKLKEYGAVAARITQAGTGLIRREEIEAYFSELEEQEFPAVHHSDVYKRLYRPAYRVVARHYLENR